MTTSTPKATDLQLLFPGDGDMARRCRAFDWERTALGAPSGWPPALRTVVRTAIESPIAMNLWCGPELVLVYNDGYRLLLGSKDSTALGQRGADVWHELWDEIAPRFDRIRAGGSSMYAENARFLMERVEGPPVEAYFTYSLSAVRDDDDVLIAVLNVAVETTSLVIADRQTREARAQAEQAEARLRSVFAQAPAFLAVMHGEQHVFEFVNDAYRQLVGDRDVVGRAVAEVLPELREQGFFELLDHVLHTGEPYVGREIAMTLQHGPGGATEQLFLDFVFQPMLDAAGHRMGIVACGSNVTDAVWSRREVERLLRESEASRAETEANEARYRFLAGAIPVHVWTASPDGMLDFVSERTVSYLGLSAERVLRDGWLQALHADDVERSENRWRHSLETGEAYEIEFRIWSAGHLAYRWHLVRASAQRDADGAIIRWFGSNTDIEDWKTTEAELHRLTIEAQEANRSKGDFLAAMSHELRTPLNAIGGYAQLIELGVRGPVTEEQKVDLRRIQRSKMHLDGLVSSVLDFAKMGVGRIELHTVPIDVERLIGSVVDMVRPQLAEKGLTLSVSKLPTALSIDGDVDRTRQILLNLLTNALKFTPGDGVLTIVAGGSNPDVTIGISDTGIGIAPEQLDSIFEPFVQAKTPLHVAGIGVGLGLAISRQLARAMGGDVTAISTLGEGSTFTLTLPKTH